MQFGFFDSEIAGYDDEGMPVFDRAQSSEFLALFISKIIGNGILAVPGDCLQVVANNKMTVSIKPGYAVINGRFFYLESDYTITIANAPSYSKRIDRVVLRCDYVNRQIIPVAKTGTPGTNPVAPSVVQPESGDYYELSLATIAVNAAMTTITQSNITDTRLDSSVCGIVTQAIDHIDTTSLYRQLQDELKRINLGTEAMLKTVYDPEGTGEVLKAKEARNVFYLYTATFPLTGWTRVSASSNGGYNFVQEVSITPADGGPQMSPTVVIDEFYCIKTGDAEGDEAIQDDLDTISSGYVTTGAGKIKVYLKEKPSKCTSLTIFTRGREYG